MGNPTHTIVSGRPISTNTTRTMNQQNPSGRLDSTKSVASATLTKSRLRGFSFRLEASSAP